MLLWNKLCQNCYILVYTLILHCAPDERSKSLFASAVMHLFQLFVHSTNHLSFPFAFRNRHANSSLITLFTVVSWFPPLSRLRSSFRLVPEQRLLATASSTNSTAKIWRRFLPNSGMKIHQKKFHESFCHNHYVGPRLAYQQDLNNFEWSDIFKCYWHLYVSYRSKRKRTFSPSYRLWGVSILTGFYWSIRARLVSHLSYKFTISFILSAT